MKEKRVHLNVKIKFFTHSEKQMFTLFEVLTFIYKKRGSRGNALRKDKSVMK